MAFNHGQIPHLLPQSYKRMISEWLEEDCPSFDYGGFVVGEEMAEARLLGKSVVGTFPLQICSTIYLIVISMFLGLFLEHTFVKAVLNRRIRRRRNM